MWGQKPRSLGQILEKPCVSTGDQIFDLILMKLGQSVCPHKILYIFLKWVISGQIIEDPMLVTKELRFKSLLFNAIPRNLESST